MAQVMLVESLRLRAPRPCVRGCLSRGACAAGAGLACRASARAPITNARGGAFIQIHSCFALQPASALTGSALALLDATCGSCLRCSNTSFLSYQSFA